MTPMNKTNARLAITEPRYRNSKHRVARGVKKTQSSSKTLLVGSSVLIEFESIQLKLFKDQLVIQ